VVPLPVEMSFSFIRIMSTFPLTSIIFLYYVYVYVYDHGFLYYHEMKFHLLQEMV
jgi:hypothetical protein